MKRVLVPELLDILPADDPRAIRSRADLARINLVMRQAPIMAKALSRLPPPRRIADLGGGDGRFLLSLARRMARRWPGITAAIADRQDIVGDATRAAFQALGWRCEVAQGDIFDTIAGLDADIVIANLFLHHFENVDLARLLAAVAATGASVAVCEPRRSRLALAGAHMVWALGANDVTRHDAVASVRAGFAGRELSACWPRGQGVPQERAVFAFSHLFTVRHD